MKKQYCIIGALVGVFLLMVSCENPTGPAVREASYHATLSGEEVVPGPVNTDARGQATFTYKAQAGRMYYKLELENISGFDFATLCNGENGILGREACYLDEVGEIIEWHDGRYDIVLKGEIFNGHLNGDMTGKTMNDLIQKIESGEMYVNVATVAHPTGELRGQLR